MSSTFNGKELQKAGNSGLSAEIIGPLLTVMLLFMIELLTSNWLAIHNPAPLYITAVVYSAFKGGLRSGLVSALITVLYASYYFSEPGQYLVYSIRNEQDLVIIALIAPTIAVLVGILSHRNRKAQEVANTNAILNTQLKERKWAEENIKKQKIYFQKLFENSPEGIIIIDENDVIQDANRSFLTMFGYKYQEVVGNNVNKLIVPKGMEDEASELTSRVSKEDLVVQNETLRRRKDGSLLNVSILGSPIRAKGDKKEVYGIYRDISEQKRSEDALRQSEEKYRTIIETIEDGFFETNLEGEFVYINQALAEITGYKREVLIGMAHYRYTDEENAAKVIKTFVKVYETGIPELGVEWEIIRNNGDKRYVEASVSLKRDLAGKPEGFRGIVRDVTERRVAANQIRESLREKEVLLTEIHHRVKNNMAVISSLLSMQSDYVTDDNYKALFRESENRIRSMAMIHEKLYQNETFSSIEFGAYTRELAESLAESLSRGNSGINVSVEAEEVYLDMITAVPCGLILNEVLTNCFKHAFNGRKTGEIIVSLTTAGDQITLAVTDNGIGLPTQEEIAAKSSLGMTLISGLSAQLGADMAFKSKKGTTFMLTFKKKAINELLHQDQITKGEKIGYYG
ncbi:MAG: PAS domain S-box protein [Balneolaceae bacterium]|nr:MAG: PAS domain S-box protein [Balneolaceae bacterium]